ncbi:MAG: hypothetical protein OXC42_08280 [Gammaproteobacteria bacterium]|nr:hypothetical protein [Gammaproteobacteria bacterium]
MNTAWIALCPANSRSPDQPGTRRRGCMVDNRFHSIVLTRMQVRLYFIDDDDVTMPLNTTILCLPWLVITSRIYLAK